MELTKQDKRVLKDIIRIGILRRCEEWLAETSTFINKEYVDDENAFDRCMEVTKLSRDFFKEAMSREDYYRNTMIELGIENLLFEGYLTEADFIGCRELFIDSCEKCLKDKIFDGWDWFVDVYEFLVMLAQTPDECRQLIRRIKKDERLSKDCYVESQMKFIHKLIEKSEGEEAALQFMMKNLQVEDFRKLAIDRAIKAKDFAQAYQLGEDGIAQEKEYRYGLISTWNDCLLKTAQAEGNRDRIVTYAKRLYLDSYNVEGDFYAILKAYVPQEQWQDFALQLAEEVQHSGREELYAEICARENWHQRLMDFVNRGLDIRTLNEYEDMLLASHRQEVIDFYIRYIWHVMEGYRCRATYQEVCDYLRHIYRLGAGQQVVVDIANELRTKYRRCPALLEELDRLSFIHS